MLPLISIVPIRADADRDFMERIFKQYYAKMKAAALHYCREGQSYEDIIQDACVGLVGNVKKLRSLSENQDALAAYIWITVRNHAIDGFEKEQRRRKNRISWEDAEPYQAQEPESMEQNLEQKEIYSVLSALSERDRILLYCKYVFGMSTRETARISHIKPSSVWTYIHNAKVRAMELIEKQGSGDAREDGQ